MTVQDNLKILSNKLIAMNSENKNYYFQRDWNGFSGERGNFYGGDYPFWSIIIGNIIVATPSERDLLDVDYNKLNPPKYFPDPGIAIFNLDNKLIDTIYWNEDPYKIFQYFPEV